MHDLFEFPKGVVYKSEICRMYGISATTLRKLLNKKYYEQLKEIGYTTTQQLLTPLQFRKFTEIYGTP